MPYTWNFDTQFVFDTPFGPLNVVAMQLFGFCLACVIAIAAQFDRALRETRYAKWHMVFLGFCLLSLTYASSAAYGLRMIAKLVAPFLFMAVILTVAKSETELQKMRNAILASGVILLALALMARAAGINSDPNVSQSGLSGLGPPGMGPPVFSAHMLPVAMVALAMCVSKPSLQSLGLVMMAAAAIIAALQRTSAAALYLGFSAILFLGTRGLWRLVLPAAGLVGLPALMLFSEAFRRRMFFGEANPQQLIADPTKALQSINGSGRFDLWNIMLRKFFDPHPIVGSGIGSTQDYLYSLSGSGVVHSEYVRLLCEVGIVGTALFAIAVTSYFLRLASLTRPSNSPSLTLRISALAAFGSLVSYIAYFSTDNGIDYVTQFGIYVFALIAVAIRENELAGAPQPQEGAAPSVQAPPFPNLMR
jgi:hypothetical protein